MYIGSSAEKVLDTLSAFCKYKSSSGIRASLVAQTVKNSPAMRETWVPSLGWEDPLEKGMASYFSGLKNSMDCTAWGDKESDPTEQLSDLVTCWIFQGQRNH